MTLERVTLLSEDEYIKYRPLIPVSEKWWWLKSRNPRYDDGVRVVAKNGYLDDYYCHVHGGVRPFCIFQFEFSDSVFWLRPEKLIGSKIQFGNYQWTILDVEGETLYALCDELVAERRFDKITNVWEASELKNWLETKGIARMTT